MTSNSNTPRSTAVYVDGYNLYYGRLRGTSFKWLDLVKLFDDLLMQRDQNENLERVHLFTAPALATFVSHGNASVEAQSAYHRALQTKYGDRFERFTVHIHSTGAVRYCPSMCRTSHSTGLIERGYGNWKRRKLT